MPSRLPPKFWLALGASLAGSGGFAIFSSLPEGGAALWLGVGLVAGGSVALRVGFAELRHETGQPGGEDSAPESTFAGDLDPAWLRPTPRPVEMTFRGKLVLSVWIVTVALFGALAHEHFGRLPPPNAKSVLDQEGAVATASVHAREERTLPDGRKLYFLAYNFKTATGTSMRINRSVSLRIFQSLAELDATRVVYAPQTPQLHYLPDITSPVSTRFVFFAGALLLVAAGLTEAQRRLHRRLVASGSPVKGLVANVRRRGGVRSFRVNYDVAGERRSLTGTERNPDLRNGQTAIVLYDPAIPSRATIYRLALYRVRD